VPLSLLRKLPYGLRPESPVRVKDHTRNGSCGRLRLDGEAIGAAALTTTFEEVAPTKLPLLKRMFIVSATV
jgi:hypothetical protein